MATRSPVRSSQCCASSCTCGLSRTAAKAVFPLVAVATVILVNVLPVISIVLSIALSISITVGAIWALFQPLHRTTTRSARDDQEAQLGTSLLPNVDDPTLQGAAIALPLPGHDASPPKPKERLVYLDNLKSALTAIVVVHHCLGAFAGGGSVGLSVGNFRNDWQPVALALQLLDQSWFMSAFFFLSALLTPSSLDRKGVREFIIDKLRRLGLPFALYFWVLQPTLGLLVDQAVVGGRPILYAPNAGPPWFLCWLLIFNACYLLVASPAPGGDGTSRQGGGASSYVVCARPSLPLLCLIGAALGLLQAVQFIFLPIFVSMPITFGSLPFDAVFFFSGILAQRNGWLEAPLPRGEAAAAYALVIAIAAGAFSALGAVEAGGGGALLLSTNACGAPPTRGGNEHGAASLGGLFAASSLAGVYCMAATLAALHFFRVCANGAHGALTRFAASVSYTVYLIHPAVVLPLTGAFVAYVRAATGNDGAMRSSDDRWGNDFPDCVAAAGGSDALVLACGFAAVAAASLVAVYPLAALVRRLPVLSRVL